MMDALKIVGGALLLAGTFFAMFFLLALICAIGGNP